MLLAYLLLWLGIAAAKDDDKQSSNAPKSSTSAKDYYVWELPGLDKTTTKFHEMHAGNIVIKPDHHGSLFFWSFGSEHKIGKERTVLWLNGGPGCSSLDGALMEIGPYRLKDGGKVVENEGSWNKYANLLFVDQPLGVGFSSVDTDSYISELDVMAEDMVAFLKEYYKIFPERLQDELYIGGESFAGTYIPYIAQAILEYNKEADHPINLEGLIIGNGWVDPVQQYMSYLPFAYKSGILKEGSSESKHVEKAHRDCAESLNDLAASSNVTVHVEECEKVVNVMIDALKKGSDECINVYDVRLKDTFPDCGMNWPPDLKEMNPYLRKQEVLEALHTYSEGTTGWSECSGNVRDAFKMKSSKPAIDLIPDLARQLNILFFNGDQDLICNHLGNEWFLEKLEWNGGVGWQGAAKEQWPAGELTRARNVSYAKVTGSSHMVPFDMPDASQFMLHSFMGLQPWDGKHNVSDSTINLPDLTEQKDKEKEKEVNKAKWKAYQQAGSAALVVLVIVLCLCGVFLWRSNRRREYIGSTSSKGLFRSFIGGLMRWKPKRFGRGGGGNTHRRTPSGSYVELNNPRRRASQRHTPDIILEEEELGDSPLGGRSRGSYEDDTELDTFVVDEDDSIRRE